MPATGYGQTKLEIDIKIPPELFKLEDNLKKKIPGVMRKIALEGKSFWKTLAGQKLKSSRVAYQKGIEMESKGKGEFVLRLQGFLPYAVEYGADAFDMKPGLLKNAKPLMGGKKKFPRALADNLPARNDAKQATKYRVVPLNVNRYVNMKVPTVFRTVTDQSPQGSWMHPGFKGMHLADEVIRELEKNIIPKHVDKMLKDIDKP